MQRKILQHESSSKWSEFHYIDILKKIRQKLASQGFTLPISPDAAYLKEKFIIYKEEDVTFIITSEYDKYIIYQFSTCEKNVLGKGAYGKVHAGKNLTSGEDVAIKTNHDDPHPDARYTRIPPGWGLVKSRLNDYHPDYWHNPTYKPFAKIYHYGVGIDIGALSNETKSFKVSFTKDTKVYLVMEKLQLKPCLKKLEHAKNIKTLWGLRIILQAMFDAITRMHNCNVQGIDWGADDNLQLNDLGYPKLIDYDNWCEANNLQEKIRETNYAYSWLILIIDQYYSQFHAGNADIAFKYRDEIRGRKELLSREEFFHITNDMIAIGEKKKEELELRIKDDVQLEFGGLRV